jgi:hypothetical protein
MKIDMINLIVEILITAHPANQGTDSLLDGKL